MSKQDPWFFRERAVAFASLRLTDRANVIVRAQADADMGIDLLVEVLKGRKSTLRFFGVQIVACMDLPDKPDSDERLLSRQSKHPTEASFPICLFVIGVRKPEGIYRWSVEPVIEEGRPVLRRWPVSRREVNASWHPLDEVGGARLIDQVNAWYDALNGDSAPAGRARHAQTESHD
jgi:hypothetical protein